MRRRPITRCASCRMSGSAGSRCGGWGRRTPVCGRSSGGRTGALPAASAIDPTPAGTQVDIEGNGEILKIASVPVQGVRQALTTIRRARSATCAFRSLPSPYVVERTGYKPGLVALTFDDGPDPNWTPRVLDILKAKQVPGTFLHRRRKCADAACALLDRMVREGHEVGSHTYTHPNLAGASQTETTFQLNTTQRLFQAFTGRSLRLFRAPYFGDAEPTTADEIDPAMQAQNRGYISVGLHVDPGDWKRPGVQANHRCDGRAGDRSGRLALHGRPRRRSVAATSSCSTMPVVTARRRSRRCR